MDKLLRNAPTISVIIVLALQLKRVSDFGYRIGAGGLSWVYASFLAFSIYSLSYWTGRLYYEITADKNDPKERRKYISQIAMQKKYERARFNSALWLILFVFIDGWLNLAETMAALPVNIMAWEHAGAIVYGIFPTLAAYGLGSLQSMIDKIPTSINKHSLVGKIVDKLLVMIDDTDKQDDKQPTSTDKQLTSTDKQDDKVVAPLLTDESLLDYVNKHPDKSNSKIGKYFGVSPQAIQQRRKKLKERAELANAFAQKEEVTK